MSAQAGDAVTGDPNGSPVTLVAVTGAPSREADGTTDGAELQPKRLRTKIKIEQRKLVAVQQQQYPPSYPMLHRALLCIEFPDALRERNPRALPCESNVRDALVLSKRH